VLHVPLPDAIKVSANPDLILVGGDTSIITAQLYLNGNPYKRPNVPISFFGDNDTRAYLPTVKTNLSDANGAATIILTSNMTKGRVNVTAFSQVTVVNNLTDTCFVDVVGWGTISGMVTDKNKNGVPNATVKLWRTIANDSGVFSTTLYPSYENPQQTVSRPEIAAIGTYTYYRIPSGIYNVTAEKEDASGNNHIWFAIVNLTVGTATNNVAIPDLVISTPIVSTPTPTPTAVTVTPTPTPTATPTPTPSTPGFEMVFALAGLLGVAYLIARKEH
jgi:PGF-CTERM protein